MIDRISSAIDLVCGNSGDGWFVIFEEPETEKFVQFAFDEESGLYFDLPTMNLSADERTNALFIFRQFGVDLGDQIENFPESINLEIGFEKKLAIQLSEKVFAEIFKFDETCSINITIDR